MHYIIFDLEFNQDIAIRQNSSNQESNPVCHQDNKQEVLRENNIVSSQLPASNIKLPFEILQFGALKLDHEFHTISTFRRLVKPTLYQEVNPFITELTGIQTENLKDQEKFPKVYEAFLDFIDDPEAVFCVWGMSDIKELFRNAEYHKLDQSMLPKQYINLQPYVSLHLGLPEKKLLRLEYTVEAFQIPKPYPFHDAYHDAYYTAELFKKIYQPTIKPKLYNPVYVPSRVRQVKKKIDFDGLFRQFEKMYAREMTGEEMGIIRLAYQMGKTHQFLIIENENSELLNSDTQNN